MVNEGKEIKGGETSAAKRKKAQAAEKVVGQWVSL